MIYQLFSSFILVRIIHGFSRSNIGSVQTNLMNSACIAEYLLFKTWKTEILFDTWEKWTRKSFSVVNRQKRWHCTTPVYSSDYFDVSMCLVCDLLYHIKYQFTGDSVKADAERVVMQLRPALQLRLRYHTPLSSNILTLFNWRTPQIWCYFLNKESLILRIFQLRLRSHISLIFHILTFFNWRTPQIWWVFLKEKSLILRIFQLRLRSHTPLSSHISLLFNCGHRK